MRRSVPVLATARSVTRLFPGAGVGVRRVQVARPVVSRRKSPIPQTHVALDRCAQCDRVLAPLRPSGREHYADVPRVADPVQRFIDTGGGQHVGGLHTREVVLDRGSGIVVDEQALPQHSHGPVTTHPHRQCLQAGLDQLPLVHLIILSCFEVDSVNQFPGAQLSWQGRDGSARVSCGQTRVSGQAVTP